MARDAAHRASQARQTHGVDGTGIGIGGGRPRPDTVTDVGFYQSSIDGETYGLGEPIVVRVQFDEKVEVTGAPQVELERAVPLVIESATFNPARRERQHAVPVVEGLNGGLLVDAEDRGMTGRVQVESDDVGGLRLEVGVVGRHIARQPVRAQFGLLPDALYDILAHAEMGGKAPAGPVRCRTKA